MQSFDNKTVLLIDDEQDIRDILSLSLEHINIPCVTAENCEQAKSILQQQDISLCLTDMRLPDGTGMDIIHHIANNYPHIPVAAFTAHGNVEMAVDSLKAGAFDFISKPVRINDLRKLIRNGLNAADSGLQQHPITTLIGDSPSIIQIRKVIAKAARNMAPVHIYGAAGTGKNLVAKLVHQQSPRSRQPFVVVDCNTTPFEQLEKNLFDYQEDNYFTQADGGSILFNEITTLPLALQVDLLSVIQERKFVSNGQTIATDTRIISSSSKPLEVEVEAGNLRHDLFYRLNVIPIAIPNLNQRSEDIPLLIKHFLKQPNAEQDFRIEPDAVRFLCEQSYEANVLELENCLERACAFAENKLITTNDLELAQLPAKENDISDFKPGNEPIEDYLERTEIAAIKQALTESNDNKTQAAKLLGMSFRSFRYKLTKYGIK